MGHSEANPRTVEGERLSGRSQNKNLHNYLIQVLKDATLFFSRGETPNLSSVLPAIDEIDRRFLASIHNVKINPAIRSAIILAKRTLNWYYQKTDEAVVHRIAILNMPDVTATCSYLITSANSSRGLVFVQMMGSVTVPTVQPVSHSRSSATPSWWS